MACSGLSPGIGYLWLEIASMGGRDCPPVLPVLLVLHAIVSLRGRCIIGECCLTAASSSLLDLGFGSIAGSYEYGLSRQNTNTGVVKYLFSYVTKGPYWVGSELALESSPWIGFEELRLSAIDDPNPPPAPSDWTMKYERLLQPLVALPAGA